MSKRTDKIQKRARQILGEAILGIKDPRVGFATVTAVRITPDLRHARVWVSVLGSSEEATATMEGLASATPYLRGELGRQIRMKYLPDLTFELDQGAEEAQRLEAIIRRIHSEEDDAEEES